jgi:hypothetical protein
VTAPDFPMADANDWCPSTSHGYGCTRQHGHAGLHAAHDPTRLLLATWGDSGGLEWERPA